MLKLLVRFLVALLFIGSGIAHFVDPQPFVSIVPPYLPWPLELVWISGGCEIAGGVGLLIPKLRYWAGIGLVALLIAVYPANIYMAIHDLPFGRARVPQWVHLIRLPLQFVFIAVVIWVADLRRSKAVQS